MGVFDDAAEKLEITVEEAIANAEQVIQDATDGQVHLDDEE